MIAPVEPAVVAHFLAACAVAHLSVATIASTFRSAQEARDLYARVALLSIPDAARALHATYGGAS